MKYAREQDLGSAGSIQEWGFIGRVTGGGSFLGLPLNRQISWRQKGLLYTSGEFEIDLTMMSGPEVEAPLWPATYLCPPAAMFVTAQAVNGQTLFAYQPTVHVMGGRIVATSGPTNPVYTIENLDAALRATFVTPIDRWPGINYQSRPVNAFVLLLCTDADNLRLIAFESPVITPCPAGASASAPGPSVASLIGI